jgi:type IV secretion system protein VirB5
MIRVKQYAFIACAAAMLAIATPSQAQLAVVDAPAVFNIIQEVQAMQQVLANARSQLAQAQQALQTITGNRGMQLLLNNVVRNYLPTNLPPLYGPLQGLSASYPALAAGVLALVGNNAVLSPQMLAALSPADQQRIAAARNMAAINQALSRDALSNASGRFADLQGLIGSIGSANDQKAILELQARISAEHGMLQNEQTKLQSLYQTLQADSAASREQLQEQVIAGHGQFVSRFQPTP